ncbi:MAG: hypothetical protein AB8B84_11940 [Granulosicoccus sp.]
MNLRPATDHSLLIFLVGVFLINSPLRQWWSDLALPWYAMYVPWLVIILLVAINQLRQQRGD